MENQQPQPPTPVDTNPFNIGLEGLKQVFDRARSVAIFLVVLSGIAFLGQGVQSVAEVASGSFTMSAEQQRAKDAAQQNEVLAFINNLDTAEIIGYGVAIATVLFLFILITLFISAIIDYTAAQLAKGSTVTLKEAAKEAVTHLVSYLWLFIVESVRVFLWSLLFIIPGFIMAVRYSLSGTVFFSEGLRGNAAVNRSSQLTKGAWLTTFGSMSLWNLMTLGTIGYLLQPGTMALLYKQLRTATDAGQPKPPAHLLSWLVLAGYALMIIFVILFAVGVAAILAMAT